MIHEADVKDTLREVFEQHRLMGEDMALLESHAYELFKETHSDTLSKTIKGLRDKVEEYRSLQAANSAVELFRAKQSGKNYSRVERCDTLAKKAKEMIDLMGGNTGTIDGNALKHHLCLAIKDPEPYILSDKPKISPSTEPIRAYLRKNGSSEKAIQNFINSL